MSVVLITLDVIWTLKHIIFIYSSLIECSALCNVKAGCDMFAFDPSYQCSTGQSFDNTLIMDEYNGVPVYLRDPNSGMKFKVYFLLLTTLNFLQKMATGTKPGRNGDHVRQQGDLVFISELTLAYLIGFKENLAIQLTKWWKQRYVMVKQEV